MPSTSFEEALWAAGHPLVAGVDEVGRGPLAGPVYAAAVILDPDARPGWISELRDSKVLTATERERLSQAIRQEAPDFGVGWATVAEIDAWGISLANRMAMVRALQALSSRPQHVLIDGPQRLPNYAAPQRAIIDGDALCCTIAAASIVAKVARDAVMRRLDAVYPAYGFAAHKGYATREHLEALERHGACVEHRRSWAAVQRRGALAEVPPEFMLKDGGSAPKPPLKAALALEDGGSAPKPPLKAAPKASVSEIIARVAKGQPHAS
ncbi:MAG TPA: ribonuclease HII [Dehalococcoidia bacterium]|nr:ribonuclease HII [Dehalococcoidia bacterium]